MLSLVVIKAFTFEKKVVNEKFFVFPVVTRHRNVLFIWKFAFNPNSSASSAELANRFERGIPQLAHTPPRLQWLQFAGFESSDFL